MNSNLPITQYFAAMGAPLKRKRTSWGAVRQSDGAVILRVWKDRIIKRDGKRYVQVTHLGKYGHVEYYGESPLAYRERLEQLARIRNGADCYLVFCEAVNPHDPGTRAIKSYDPNCIRGINLVCFDNDFFIELER